MTKKKLINGEEAEQVLILITQNGNEYKLKDIIHFYYDVSKFNTKSEPIECKLKLHSSQNESHDLKTMVGNKSFDIKVIYSDEDTTYVDIITKARINSTQGEFSGLYKFNAFSCEYNIDLTEQEEETYKGQLNFYNQ